MIERRILLALRPEHQAEAEALGRRCLALLRAMPMVRDAHVAWGDPALERGPWDLAVTVVLADSAALAAYQADPVHAAFVREVLVPRVAAREASCMRRLSHSDQT